MNLRDRSITLTGLAILAAADLALAGVPPPPACAPGATGTTFVPTGAAQSMLLPSGTFSLQIFADAASGGNSTGEGALDAPEGFAYQGGRGVREFVEFSVDGPGTFTVIVGERGEDAIGIIQPPGVEGGQIGSAAGGGGASAVFLDSDALVVAGGGGGAGATQDGYDASLNPDGVSGDPPNGGAGGTSGNGGAAASQGGSGGGGGGLLSDGGDGPGTGLGEGGHQLSLPGDAAGGVGVSADGGFGGGGGGGGVGGGGGGGYGGGGSAYGEFADGGGGGGSYFSPTATNFVSAVLPGFGDGSVLICVEGVAPVTPVPTLTPAGIVALALALGAAALLVLRRRRASVS